MHRHSFRYRALAVSIGLSFLLTACAQSSTASDTVTDTSSQTSAQSDTLTTNTTDATNTTTVSVTQSSDMFTNRDMEIGYDESESTNIQLNGDSAQCSADTVTIDGSTITITDEGTYILSGTLLDGMILIDAENTDKIHLILDGVTIHSSTCAAIYVRQADKVFITLASDSENVLSNGGTFTAIDENSIDAVIFSKDDVTFNGYGTLTISSPGGHGIVGKDDLVFTSGTYTIEASGHGISANDSVRIADGNFTIQAGKHGIEAQNDEDTSLGFVYLADGTCTIQATADGIHTTGALSICGGDLTLTVGDDGLHSDTDVLISDGTILITDSYEGIEGLTITISGGNITLTSSDDGLNAAGGADSSGFNGQWGTDQFAADDSAYILISGGQLTVYASGDGIDSNGNLTVSGGEIYVHGPSSGANGSLDYNGEGIITGGTLVAAGASQMLQNFGSSSTQCSMSVTVDNQTSGSTLTLTDSSGTLLLSTTLETGYNCVVISMPQLTVGETYTLTAGTYSTSVTPDSLIYGSGSGAGFGGGGMHGGNGGGMRGGSMGNGNGTVPSGKGKL